MALTVNDFPFAQRFRWLDLHFAPNYVGSGVVVTRKQDAANMNLRSFMNAVGQPDRLLRYRLDFLFRAGFTGLVLQSSHCRVFFRRRGRFPDRFSDALKRGLRKALVEVERQDVGAVGGDVKL